MWRRWAWGAVVGPLGFVAAWAIGGVATSRPDYSPVEDTISQLARIGADTRPYMTAGMIAFGLGVPAYAVALRRALPGRAWMAAVATGVSTLGVAAAPLDHSDLVDRIHVVTAGAGYVTLAAIPFLAWSPLRAAGRTRLANFGVAMGIISALALPTSLLVSQTGLFQRIGLTAGDVFLIASVPTVRALLGHRPA